jgi:thiol-disulfide isomerase/thioredoxin
VVLLVPIRNQNGFIFAKYTSFINGGRADLSQGKKLVLLMSLDCDHCQKLAKEIVELKKKYDLPEIYTLFFQENEVNAAEFFSKTGFSSPYKIIGGEEFFEMIGANPPRCYYLNGGKVVEFWDKDIKEKIEALEK